MVRGDAPGAHPIAALLADPGVALLRKLASNARARTRCYGVTASHSLRLNQVDLAIGR